MRTTSTFRTVAGPLVDGTPLENLDLVPEPDGDFAVILKDEKSDL